MHKSYHIITFGCQMNESDSERIAAVLERFGYVNTDDAKKADVVVINACSVRQKAVDKIWGIVGSLRKLQTTHYQLPPSLIMTGCVLPADRNKFSKRVDLFFDIKRMGQLEDFLGNIQNKHTPMLRSMGVPNKLKSKTPYVPIMNGCNNFCSYCVVPYVRGREVSRSVKDVLKEIKALIKVGRGDITLLGQNVNSYNPTEQIKCLSNPFKNKFASLLYEINRIKGVERISFLTSHPKDMNNEIIKALALPKMANYLHLALQSGDDVILKKMNRGYTAADYIKIIEKVRAVKPNIEIGTDIIVGFPGETKKQFENTLKVCKKVRFNVVYLAQYSVRKGTAAEKMKDNVPAQEKKRRWKEANDVIAKFHPSVLNYPGL